MVTSFYFRALFTAAVLTLILAPLVAWFFRRWGLVDEPGRAAHKQHDRPTPYAGGVVLVIVLGALAWGEGLLASSEIRALLAGSLLVFFFGFWDDLRELSVPVKLLGQVIAALVVVRFGVQVHLFDQDWLNQALTLLWLVGITNAYNFVDSMDGLATGLTSVGAAFFMLVTLGSGQDALLLLSTLLLGTGVGLFYFNTVPAHLFLGDSGSQFLGFLLAGLAIAYNPPGFERSASWHVPILLVGVPIFDTALVIVSRLRRRQPVYQAGLDHTYHRLVTLGMSSHPGSVEHAACRAAAGMPGVYCPGAAGDLF